MLLYMHNMYSAVQYLSRQLHSVHCTVYVQHQYETLFKDTAHGDVASSRANHRVVQVGNCIVNFYKNAPPLRIIFIL